MTKDRLLSLVKIGMTRRQVFDACGEPDDVSRMYGRHREPMIFKYGKLELHFKPSPNGGLVFVYTEDEKGQGTVLLKD